MLLFTEAFDDPLRLAKDWIVAPGTALQNGLLAFCPGEDETACVGVTRRNDFRDFSLTADVRIVRSSVGLVLRAVAPGQYYLVQFDLAGDPSAVWFHIFTPSAERSYRVDRVLGAHVPRAEAWHCMKVAVKAYGFEVSLGGQAVPSSTAPPGRMGTRPTGRAGSASGSTGARGASIGTCAWIALARKTPDKELTPARA